MHLSIYCAAQLAVSFEAQSRFFMQGQNTAKDGFVRYAKTIVSCWMVVIARRCCNNSCRSAGLIVEVIRIVSLGWCFGS